MRLTKLLLTLLLSAAFLNKVNSQGYWVTINSARGNFSFSFPQNVSGYDTLNLLTYITTPNNSDSTISFQVNFIDSVYISGNDELQNYLYSRFGINQSGRLPSGDPPSPPPSDPCYVDSIQSILVTYAQMFQFTTQGTIEGFETSDYQPCYIRGKELAVRHPHLSGDGGYYFTFTRYFYWNNKFLAFTVTGPEERLSEIYSYKSQLFTSIIIY